MKFNPTFLEYLLFLLTCLSLYVWLKYGRRIRRWLGDYFRRHRGPRTLKPKAPSEKLYPSVSAKAHEVVPSALILMVMPVSIRCAITSPFLRRRFMPLSAMVAVVNNRFAIGSAKHMVVVVPAAMALPSTG